MHPGAPTTASEPLPEGLLALVDSLASANAHAAELMAELEVTRQALEARNAELHQKILELERVEALTAAKSQFLANVSHELRTPMNGVLGMCELLLESSLDGRDRQYAETIRTSARALLAVINDLLDVSKLEGGYLTLDEGFVEMADVATEVVDFYRSSGLAQVPIELHVARDVAGSFPGDSARVRQVLMNLVGNAVKFTPEGRIRVDVGCLAQDDARYVRVSVQDSGIGIAESDMGRLFRSFSQVDASDTRRFGGTGLGLALSKGLVELMGGRIGAESQVGVGSRFWADLPVPPGQARASVGAKPDLHRRTALLYLAAPVEELMITQFLLRQGCAVRVAKTADEVCEQARGGGAAVAFVDCASAGPDCATLIGRLREAAGAECPMTIVAITSSPRSSLTQAPVGDCDDVLERPIEFDALRALLARRCSP